MIVPPAVPRHDGFRRAQRLSVIGREVLPREQQTPEALAAYYKSETDIWWPIIKATGIKAE